MRRILTLAAGLTLSLTTPPAPAGPLLDENRAALRTVRDFGDGVTFQEKLGTVLFVGGVTSTILHVYVMSHDTALNRVLLYVLYRGAAFPLAIVGTWASGAAALFGGFLYAISPTCARAGSFTEYLRSEEGLPTFLAMTEDEQLKYMSWDRDLAAFVREAARRLRGVTVNPAIP